MTSPLPISAPRLCEEAADAALRRRAARVIPGGLWGHMNAARLPEGYPQYFARARGCRLWDVDGREYLDFMCSYGPMILGYGDEDVERAAARQRAEADIANGPAPCLVELAELVVELTGSESVVEHLPLPADDPKLRRPDISLAREQLGWEPTVPLREGLARTIEWFRQSNELGVASRVA